MWYSKLYRRHLLDMHIEDWNEGFLSRFDIEAYVNNLKKAHINYAMIYLQSHVGLCYYPTKLGTMHSAFSNDPLKMKRLVDACHREEIKVCGYYSLIYNTREHDKHPQWRLVDETGRSGREKRIEQALEDSSVARKARYGYVCPNNPWQQNFVFGQIKEMLDIFDVDAMFFDMPFWPNTCYCWHCQEKYREFYSKPIPCFGAGKPVYWELDSEKKSEYRQLLRFKSETMGRAVSAISGFVKKLRPDMPVEFNFAQAVAGTAFCGCAEEVGRACDFVGGDLYGDILNHSFSCKFFRAYSRNQPFEQMFSRCKPALSSHTLTKSIDQMKLSVASTMAHHGATLVIDAIDPVGTVDERLYDKIARVFELQKPYEKYFCGEMARDIGIFYSIKSRIELSSQNSLNCSVRFCSGLIRQHIPVSVVGPYGDLEDHSFIAAPMLSVVDEGDRQRLKDYVRNGGVLYLSGFEAEAFIGELTGHRFLGNTDDQKIYLAPKRGAEDIFGEFNETYPLPMGCSSPIVKPAETADILAVLKLPYTKPSDTAFASIHSDPPGIMTDIPALTVNSYGKGKVIWSAVPIESEPYDEYTELILRLFNSVKKHSFSFESHNAPSVVELTLFKSESFYTLNAVLLSDAEKAFSLCPFKVRVKLSHNPKAVTAVGTGEKLPFEYNDGYLEFNTQRLEIFEMYKIDI